MPKEEQQGRLLRCNMKPREMKRVAFPGRLLDASPEGWARRLDLCILLWALLLVNKCLWRTNQIKSPGPRRIIVGWLETSEECGAQWKQTYFNSKFERISCKSLKWEALASQPGIFHPSPIILNHLLSLQCAPLNNHLPISQDTEAGCLGFC